jgi:Methylamine utilisation protein MauE
VALVLLAARWLIAGLFLRSGLAKAAGLADFRSAVANYRLLPSALVRPVAVVLPLAEIVAAVLLALGILPLVVASVLAVLLVAFATAIGINLARGRVFDCGCAGSDAAPRMISWPHVATNLVLAVLAAAVAVASAPTMELWRGPAAPVHLATPSGGGVQVLLAVLVCLALLPVLRRAVAVRGLVTAAGDALAGNSVPSSSRRH